MMIQPMFVAGTVFLLAIATIDVQSSRATISQVIWHSDPECVARECRLQPSATLTILTSSCPRERCSVSEMVPSSQAELNKRRFSLVLPQYDQETLDVIMQAVDGLVDVFVFSNAKSEATLGNVDVYEYGKKKLKTFNMLQAVRRGTFGGIRGLQQGPIPKPDELVRANKNERFTPVKECARIIRRHSIGLDDGDVNSIVDAMSKSCFGGDEFPSSTAVEDHRDELWKKAHELGLIPEGRLQQLPAVQYTQAVWEEVLSDSTRSAWLSVSWVPVFDEFHQGLGHGDRYEVLLIELVQVEPFTDVPNASPVLTTKGGKQVRVGTRRILALSACEDDDLESVLSCLRASVPNVFQVEQIVWGMGFVGDKVKYGELEQDWNADPVYESHGEMPPRYEDEDARTTRSDEL